MNKQQLIHMPYINNEDRDEHGSKKRFTETRHHICPSSVVKGKGGPTIKLYENIHRAYHALFGNGLMQDALLQMLKINGPALSDKYTKDIQEIISMSDNYVFRDGIRIKR